MEDKAKFFHNERALMECVRRFEKRYIYGAGYVGKLLERRLRKKGINVNSFLTSEHSADSDNTYCLEEVSVDEQSIIIVAVTRQYRDDLIANLKKKNISQYIVVSDKLITSMDRIDGGKLRFQIHLVEHCNLNCRGCYHFSPLANEEYIDVNEFQKDIIRLAFLFGGKAEEILLLGGEPLLHPQLEKIIEICRELFPIGKIKILTNGTLLLTVDNTFFEVMRLCKIELWVTRYPIQFDYDAAEKRAIENNLEVHYFADEENGRTLGHEPLDLDGKRNHLDNFYNCYRANECVDLKHGRLFPCIVPAEVKAFNEYFGEKLAVSQDDSIDIYGVESGEELLEKLEIPIPFCRFCNRDDVQVIGRIPWSRTKYEIKEWTE